MIKMKAFLLISPVLLILCSFVSAEDKAVAKVGDSVIRESQLEEALDSYKPPGSFHKISPDNRKKFRKDALNDLIEFELLHKEAQRQGIKVKGSLIEEVIKENEKRFGSKKKFKDYLKKKGLTIDDFKEKVRRYHMVIALLNNLFKASEYKEEELKEYYGKNKYKFKRPEGIHLYHIMIKVESGSTEEERAKRQRYAEEILEKIRSGGDFGEIAYNYSEDAYKYKSGDLGFVHRGQLEPEIEKVAFSLKEGELSGVVKSIYGFHILKAGERLPEKIMTFDEVRDKLKKDLDTKRFDEKRAALLNRLKGEYPVEIYIRFEEERTGQTEGNEGISTK